MLLSRFAAELAAGLCWTLACTSPALVNPGYFRSSLLIVLGLVTLAGAAGWDELGASGAGVVLAAGVLSYAGSTVWYLERRRVGQSALYLLSCVLLVLIWLEAAAGNSRGGAWWDFAGAVAAAGLLGSSLGAMLLGHCYLTAPWMSLAPLRRDIAAILILCLVRATLAGLAASVELAANAGQSAALLDVFQPEFWPVLRWLVGTGGPAVLAIMAWQTLRLKNTQSATGILYVLTICVFLGESTALITQRATGVPR